MKKVVDKSVRGKSVRFDGDRLLEYEIRDGRQFLVAVRPIYDVETRDLAALKELDIIAFNSEAEKAFIEILSQMCDQAGAAGVSVRTVRAEVAYRLGISTETAKRYIEKWCVAPSAPFQVRDGVIFAKGKK